MKTIKILKAEFDNDNKLFNDENIDVVLPEVELLDENIDWDKILRSLERAIRTAYQSFDKVSEESHYNIIKLILSKKHESTLEHEKITFKVITNRWVTHELVRHRIASYTQESTRYVDPFKKWWYKIIYPAWIWTKDEEIKNKWYLKHVQTAKEYKNLIELWLKPEEARWILPNDLKTEIVVTMNLREIRHFIWLRWSQFAHPDIRVISHSLLELLHDKIPLLFDDLYEQIFAIES